MGRQRHNPPNMAQICREYLAYFKNTRQSGRVQKRGIQKVIRAFSDYLDVSQIQLSDLKIEHVDAFLAAFKTPYAPSTRQLYRSYLRCFLRYLYHERNLLPQDLAELVVGPPMFAKAKPPKFLRPHEIRQLFDHLPYSTHCELRTYAMVHLAFFLGLRPCEISQITLDDISFSKAQLILRHRKNNRPLQLPIPESTLKAITAYIVGARPKVEHRFLFVLLVTPYNPIDAALVGRYLTRALCNAGIDATPYWLRHTYAQNLLEADATLFEIKEMLGHDSIESTRKYLSIHTALMRKVLFDEIL
ncbi:tyrosine-type recombinase/integrase [Desulfococcus sp.]|uniref:tyrosine-type recombinase/integrase n=1 Tax=Desulfococcus sp. TaxID=2025834 RepID=UPI0035944934